MTKTKIIPFDENKPESKNDNETYDRLLNKLSLMHLDHSNDQAILSDASFREFKGEYWPSVPGDQRDLLMIAIKYKLSWTQ